MVGRQKIGFENIRTSLIILLCVLCSRYIYAQTSRFSFDLQVIGMRVTPNLQSQFVMNDWTWVDPISGNEYLEFKADEPRGTRFKFNYAITKKLTFNYGIDRIARYYYMFSGDPYENAPNFRVAETIGFLFFDSKFFGTKLHSSSHQLGFTFSHSFREMKFQVYASYNAEQYEHDFIRRDIPITYGNLINSSLNIDGVESYYLTQSEINVVTDNQNVKNNFWSLNTGVSFERKLNNTFALKFDFGFRNTALWKKNALETNAVVINAEHSLYYVDDEFLENPYYTVKRDFDFPLYLGGFYGAFGLSISPFKTAPDDENRSKFKRFLVSLIQLKE